MVNYLIFLQAPIGILLEKGFLIFIGLFLCVTCAKNYFKSKSNNETRVDNMEQKLKNLAKAATESND
tara:strand:+ start:1374 stop:1574 length:201 start_codon:yes stop_codon:yes gene_type:complete